MIRRLTILLLIVGFLIADVIPEYENYPGGYIGFAIGIGKTNKQNYYLDTQISKGFHIADVPSAIFFLGTSIGMRFSKYEIMPYMDIQSNIWSQISVGYGKGFILKNKEGYFCVVGVPTHPEWSELKKIAVEVFEEEDSDDLDFDMF